MTRKECEKAILLKLIEIEQIHKEYYPWGDYLSMSIVKTSNGNDKGDWDCMSISVNNEFYSEDAEYPINASAQRDIRGNKYWKCITKEEDQEQQEHCKQHGYTLLNGYWWIPPQDNEEEV